MEELVSEGQGGEQGERSVTVMSPPTPPHRQRDQLKMKKKKWRKKEEKITLQIKRSERRTVFKLQIPKATINLNNQPGLRTVSEQRQL